MWGGVLRGPQDVLVQMQVEDLVTVSVALRMSQYRCRSETW